MVLLNSLARVYDLNVQCSRDAPDAEVHSMFRGVVLKVHPDRGGCVEDQQKLNQARERWNQAKAKPKAKARPTPTSSGAKATAVVACAPARRREFRICSGVLLFEEQLGGGGGSGPPPVLVEEQPRGTTTTPPTLPIRGSRKTGNLVVMTEVNP